MSTTEGKVSSANQPVRRDVQPQAKPSSAVPSPAKVLVVESDLKSAMYWVQRLIQRGREVIYTFTREDAVRIMGREPIDLLVAGSDLSDGSGLDVVRAGMSRNARLEYLVVDRSGGSIMATLAAQAIIHPKAAQTEIRRVTV